MKITNVDGPPGFQEFDDIEDRMTSEHVEDVREIFNTPLTGSYNWITLLQITESKGYMN